MNKSDFTEGLDTYLKNIESEFSQIPGKRTETLKLTGDWIVSSLKKTGSADLVFICTHNSRRSQFGQVWASTAARYYGIDNINGFSGGTEVTAFNPSAVAAIQRAGFITEGSPGQPDNPIYIVKSGAGISIGNMFSKKYDDPVNPAENFCAIMVCSDADEACPLITGATERISLPYEDPKTFDGSGLESRKYDERCREIARDLFFVFNYVGQNM